MKETCARPILFRPRDCLVFLLVLVLAALVFCLPILAGRGLALAVVTDRGTVYYPLSENREILLEENGYSLIVVIEDGAVFVRETDCPEQICRRTGRIMHAGESILCSRAQVFLRIDGKGAYDAVAG